MNNFLILLFSLCLVALVIGVIKPQLVIWWGNTEKINRKSVFKYYGTGLLVFLILFVVCTKVEKAFADRIVYDTGITYSQLSKTPDNFKGKKVEFSGKVIDLVETGKEVDLQIAVDGNNDNVLLVAYKTTISATRILKGDNVTIKGSFRRIYTYKSTSGGDVSMPLVYVDKITKNQ